MRRRVYRYLPHAVALPHKVCSAMQMQMPLHIENGAQPEVVMIVVVSVTVVVVVVVVVGQMIVHGGSRLSTGSNMKLCLTDCTWWEQVAVKYCTWAGQSHLLAAFDLYIPQPSCMAPTHALIGDTCPCLVIQMPTCGNRKTVWCSIVFGHADGALAEHRPGRGGG